MSDPDATANYRPVDPLTSSGRADLATRSAVDLPADTVTRPADMPTMSGGEPQPGHLHPIDTPPGFVIERELGIGGMGVVYLARQVGLNRPVALKLVKAGERVDPKALIRFLAEAESVAAVKHPNVVEVYQYGEHRERPYMALEFCPGGDLRSWTRNEGGRDAVWYRSVADLMAKVADGVQAAHSLGIVHRDLKPHNVFLAADGTPKVADFGLAKRGLGSDLTHTGAVMGTPAYMAPEQAGGGTKFVGPEADVWALGVMLYELCCGGRPIDTSGPVLDAIARVARGGVGQLRIREPATPTDLALIAHKCLSADPRDRYPTAGGLRDDLWDWLDGKPITARPTGTVERVVKWAKRNKTLAGMAALTFLTMAAATGTSLGFGLEANGQRNNAVSAAGQANTEKEAAVAARNDLAAERDRANRALARSLLAQMADRGGTSLGFTDTMSEYEWEAVWDLAEERGRPVGLVFLEEATGTPLNVVRFQNRAKYLIHAAVGLDSRQRDAVDALVARRLRDPALPLVTRQQVARAAVAGEVVGRSAGDIADELVPVVERSGQGDGLGVLAAVGPSVPPDRVERVLAALIAALDKVPPEGQEELAASISRIWTQLPPEKVGRRPEELRRQLVDRIRVSNPSTRDPQHLCSALALVSRHLGEEESEQPLRELAGELIASLGKCKDHSQREVLVSGVCMVIACLPPDAADREFEKLTDWLVTKWEAEAVADERWRWLRLLAKLGGRGGDVRVAERLLNGLDQGKLTPEGMNLVLALAVIAERLPPADRERVARRAAKPVAVSLDEEVATDESTSKVMLLASVAQLLPPAEAGDLCLPAARAVLAGLLKPVDPKRDALGGRPTVYRRVRLADILGCMSPLLPAEGRADLLEQAVAQLTQDLKARSESDLRTELACGLVFLAMGLPAERAVEIRRQAADVLSGGIVEVTKAGGGARPVTFPSFHNPPAASFLYVTCGVELPPLAFAKAFLNTGGGSSFRYLRHRTLHAQPLAALAGAVTLHPQLMPKVHPLAPQTLVDLLKHPFVIQEARRAVLDALEVTYGRSFADLWEFVAFAEKEHRELDLLTPPKRPVYPPAGGK